MINIITIPLAELYKDRAASRMDRNICRKLASSHTTPEQHRLLTMRANCNQRIIEKIEAELERRQIGGMP